MKATVEIADGLFAEAKKLAKERDVTLRELIECGLRKELRDRQRPPTKRRWRDLSFGDPNATSWLRPPFTEDDWGAIRAASYVRDPEE
jgi:hypothetical protein